MLRQSLILTCCALTTWAQIVVPSAPAPVPPPVRPKRIRVGQVQENQCLGPAGFWICGAILSERQLIAYEQAVLVNPEDLCARGQIISRGRSVDHIIWMIHHHPEWDGFTANPLYRLENPPGLPLDSSSYDLVKRSWLEQAVPTQTSGIVLHNASSFFAFHEPALAVELLKRAIELEPNELVYVERLGMLYAICLMPSSLEHGVTDTPAFRALSEEARKALQRSRDWILLAGALTAAHGGVTPDDPDLYTKLEEVRPGEEPWSIVAQLPSRNWRRSKCVPAPVELK